MIGVPWRLEPSVIGVGSEVGIDLAEGDGDKGPVREAGLVRSHRPARPKGTWDDFSVLSRGIVSVSGGTNPSVGLYTLSHPDSQCS